MSIVHPNFQVRVLRVLSIVQVQSKETKKDDNQPTTHTIIMPAGILALLDLPAGTSLTVDGKSILLKRDDFVAFNSIPSHCFHLATVQAASPTKGQQSIEGPRHGFILLSKDDAWIDVHRYDPLTEEVSSESVDNATCCNLEATIRQNQLGSPRVIPYTFLLSDKEREEWKQATCFIEASLLLKRKVSHGDKIVSGGFVADNAQDVNQEVAAIVDGRHFSFPPIPVLGETPLRHTGTKRFLSKLSASQRTITLMEGPSAALLHVIETYYDNDWNELLGDIQLAFVLFLNMHCLSSLEHWRDLVTMLSLAITKATAETYKELFTNFATLLQLQMKYMDKEFFDDTDFSDGNFFLSAITRLIDGLLASEDNLLQRKASDLRRAASTIFTAFSLPSQISMGDHKEEDNGEDDSPVVVSVEEFDAFLSRSAGKEGVGMTSYPAEQTEKYPLLFASMQPHEDILMACSRALDSCVDVSLVREAAAYLEEVEVHT